MGAKGVQRERAAAEPLIARDEPAPFVIENHRGKGRAVLCCDHASAYIPRRLNFLGLEAGDRLRHIAWDIGAAQVARRLSGHLDAPLFLAGYSRLVVDCNRPLRVADIFAECSEDTPIPGNIGISVEERAERASTFYWPYHDALHAFIDARAKSSTVPVLISVHSFTPVYRGVTRRWHIGVHYRLDPRLARLVLEGLRRDRELVVGENEPYEVTLDEDYTVPVHAERRGLPYVLFEIRQDLITADPGVEAWADRLAAILLPALDHPSISGKGDPANDVSEPRYQNGVPR